MKEKNKNSNDKKLRSIERSFAKKDKPQIKSDVLGSYTGITDENEMPVQDADDL